MRLGSMYCMGFADGGCIDNDSGRCSRVVSAVEATLCASVVRFSSFSSVQSLVVPRLHHSKNEWRGDGFESVYLTHCHIRKKRTRTSGRECGEGGVVRKKIKVGKKEITNVQTTLEVYPQIPEHVGLQNGLGHVFIQLQRRQLSAAMAPVACTVKRCCSHAVMDESLNMAISQSGCSVGHALNCCGTSEQFLTVLAMRCGIAVAAIIDDDNDGDHSDDDGDINEATAL